MRKMFEKRVLPVLAAVCLLVTMVAVAMSFASAATPGTFDGDNYVAKTINYRIGSFNLNDADVLTYSSTAFFTGDTLHNNQGNWWKDYNGKWSYNDGTTQYVSGNVYWLKFNNVTNPVEQRVAVGRGEGNFVLTAGQWEVRVELEKATDANGKDYGTKVILVGTFTVVDPSPELIPSSELSSQPSSQPSSNPSSNTSSGASSFNPGDPAYGKPDKSIDYSPRIINMSTKGGDLETNSWSNSSPSKLINFTTDTVKINGDDYAAFFVGDKLKNTHWWKDVNFSYSGGSGAKINDAYLKSKVNGIDVRMQVGYGHTVGGTDDPYEFTKSGEYILVANVGGKEYELAHFFVFWPTQDIIDQLVEKSENGGAFYYEKQRVNLMVNDTTGTMCDYVGTDVEDIHVSDSLYITEVWSSYRFEYRINGTAFAGDIEKVYIYGVDGDASGYKAYVPGKFGEDDKYVDANEGYQDYIDVNDPQKVDTKLLTLEKSGKYAIYGTIKNTFGDEETIYMGSFTVTATPTTNILNPKFTNSKGVYDDINDVIYAYQPRTINYYINDTNNAKGNYVKFEESNKNIFYVTDNIANGSGYWQNSEFTYVDVYGKTHVGKIYNVNYVYVGDKGTTNMGNAQVGYGHSNGTGDSAFTLTKAGLWMLIGQQIEDNSNGRINNVVLNTFTVFELNSDDPRGEGDQFTDVSDALKWSGDFNKKDFRGDRNNINANGYLYAKNENLVSLTTIAPMRLGTKFNITATYAKNVQVGASDGDCFVVVAGDLELRVARGDLGIYEAAISYRGALLGTANFTEDYKSATGTYVIDNNLGKISVTKDDKAITWISAATGKNTSVFDISGDYYFNVAYVTVGVGGNGSYIPYLRIKPIDPTVINLTKAITFEKFSAEDFKGSTGNINAEGNLVANGRDLPTITTVNPYNLGDGFEISTSFMRTNGYSNYYGEKYALTVGDIKLKVGSKEAGKSDFVAELYYKDVLLGVADRGTAGGYSISGTWTIRFENGNISVVCLESKDSTKNTIKFVSEVTGNEVTSFTVDDWDFERTYISVTAAGNYGPNDSCYVKKLSMAPQIGALSGVGSTAGSSSSSAKTGDTTASLYIILATIAAAGAALVTARKIRIA